MQISRPFVELNRLFCKLFYIFNNFATFISFENIFLFAFWIFNTHLSKKKRIIWTIHWLQFLEHVYKHARVDGAHCRFLSMGLCTHYVAQLFFLPIFRQMDVRIEKSPIQNQYRNFICAFDLSWLSINWPTTSQERVHLVEIIKVCVGILEGDFCSVN